MEHGFHIEKDFNFQEEEFKKRGETAAREIVGPYCSIEFNNITDFYRNPVASRFLFARTSSAEKGRSGFLKMARMDERRLHEQLSYESKVMGLAHALAIPVVERYQPYHETTIGLAGFHVKLLEAEQGDLLMSDEFISQAHPDYGTRAAHTLSKTAGKEMPLEIDITLFKQSDDRNRSPESFFSVWDRAEKKIFSAETIEEIVKTTEEVTRCRRLIQHARTYIKNRLSMQPADSRRHYFVHNDAAPNNMFFPLNEAEPPMLLDYEHAGVTRYPDLAKLTDYGNFYARAWPNPAFQRAFLKALFDQESGGDVANNVDTALFLKTVISFGAMALAKYGMEKSHPEHGMSKKLLREFTVNSNYVDSLILPQPKE